MGINLKGKERKELLRGDIWCFCLQREFQMLLRASGNFERAMEAFLATGNAPSTHVSLPQYKGLTIVAENINRMRYMSHFK